MRGRCGKAAREHRFPGASLVDGYSNSLGSRHHSLVHPSKGAGVHSCIKATLQHFGWPVNCTAADVQVRSITSILCCSYAHPNGEHPRSSSLSQVCTIAQLQPCTGACRCRPFLLSGTVSCPMLVKKGTV